MHSMHPVISFFILFANYSLGIDLVREEQSLRADTTLLIITLYCVWLLIYLQISFQSPNLLKMLG